MDASLSDTADFSYSHQQPIIVAASSDVAMARAKRTIGASNLRIGAEVPIALAKERIAQQAAIKGVWIEVDHDCGAPLDELLRHLSRDVAVGRYCAVVALTADVLDAVAASVNDDVIELIVDGDEAERLAALAIASVQHRAPLLLSDVASDNSAERLRRLSEEVNRIASTLARLSTTPPARLPVIEKAASEQIPPVSVERVRSIIRARRLRSRFFADDLFADPAWDMMLDLLQAEIAQLRVPVSSLCLAAAVPATTALRWLKTLVNQGLFIRRSDPHDGRRVFVELAPETSDLLRRYFAEIDAVSV